MRVGYTVVICKLIKNVHVDYGNNNPARLSEDIL